MKNFLKFSLVLFLSIFGCDKEDLRILNPNDPGLGSLNSEDGIKAFAAGLLEKPFGWHNNFELGTAPFMIAVGHHSVMGDDMYVPWGNWGWRWSALYSKIRILATGTEYQHTLYPGISQQEFMQANNSRAAGEVNAFKYEWVAAYWTIQQANQLLDALDSDVPFAGNAENRKNFLRAWAYWWKGYMYSRVGSIYLAGLIVDQQGTTNPNYVTRQEIIDEATRNFNLADAIFQSLPYDDDYLNVWNSIIPDFNNKTAVVTPEMWRRAINTYKARNILVNKKIIEMTDTDWNAIIALANNGVQAGDNILTLGMTADGNNDFVGAFFHPYWWNNFGYGWWFVSERLIQEYKSGDLRFTRSFFVLPTPEVNKRNRGWNFGTRYGYVDIEDGGMFATSTGQGQWPISPTYEENQLMLAEAKLRKSSPDIDGALTHVDMVRDYQGAGLDPVSGTGLSLAAALEEFRRERRVALALRGLSFYDARRWGVTAPESAGGGRNNAMVMIPFSVYDPESDGQPGVYPCFIEYNYMDYWDLPADELDFNIPAPGSPPVIN